jgi:hypothetical protein
MTNSVQVTILGLLILITFVNVGLIAYPFGWQGEATTALNNSKAWVRINLVPLVERTFIIFVGKLSNPRTRPNIALNAIIHISVETSRI